MHSIAKLRTVPRIGNEFSNEDILYYKTMAYIEISSSLCVQSEFLLQI